MAEYRKEMGPPPVDIDQLSALPPAKRRVAEARLKGMRYTGTKDGKETRRDVKGWEWEIDPATGVPQMSETSAALMREQAGELARETKGALRGTRAVDKSRSMGNPASFAKGGAVRGSGCEQRGLRKCKVV